MFDRLQKLLLTTTTLVPLGLVPAAANPQGPQIVGGSATIQGQGTATVTVTQQTNSAIINWNTFNIGTGEKTNIAMPSSSSVQLDRVTGGLGPSQILGSLWSNGRVFLVNPDGILFGSGAKVDTAGFLATTHDIANGDFMAGRYNFSIPGNPSASIVNQGTITAQTGGFAALVAPGVRNSGTITATLGTVALASGNGFTLDFYGDRLITLGLSDSIATTVKDVATGQPLNALVKNEGTLQANGGRVELNAVAARQVVDSVINNTGVIEANSIGTKNGMIVLGAATAASKPAGAPTQTVKVSGTLSAAGKNAGQTGGKIQITGEAIQVTGAKIDASGVAGGGTVLIGGDWSGGNPTIQVNNLSATLESYSVPTARSVLVDPTSIVDVSATISGNGGKVIVWADQATSFSGSIFARGGPLGGDGGFVETSGHQQLAFSGKVDTGAPNGKRGTLLLDPLNATIADTPGSGIITTASIENALLTGDVLVTTVGTTGTEAGDITVASNLSWASASTLTLNAYRDIWVNATITNTSSGNLVLRADATGTGVGSVGFGGPNGGGINFLNSTGKVTIYYNPAFNPDQGTVNTTTYTNPIGLTPFNVLTTQGPCPLGFSACQERTYMLVNTIYDLQDIKNNLFGNYALGKDIIDASTTATWNSGAGFVSIGTNSMPFSGIFDGQFHTINGLTINQNLYPVGSAGLFARSSGVIQGVTLTNVSVTGSSTGEAIVGGLVGVNDGLISDSSVTGTASGYSGSNFEGIYGGLVGYNTGTIQRSYANVTVTGYGSTTIFISFPVGGQIDAGGLVGRNDGTISQSYALGSVTGADGSNFIAARGGLVGINYGSIDQSYAMGSVGSVSDGADIVQWNGGFAGLNNGSVSQSYSTGAILGRSDGAVGASISSLGGLIGIGNGSSSNSYWDTQTSGQATSAGGTGLTTAQFQSGLPTGFDPTVWGINPTINNGYPYLKWQAASTTPPTATILTPAGVLTFTSISQLDSQLYSSRNLYNSEDATACKATVYAILAIAVLQTEGNNTTAASIKIDDFYVKGVGASWSGNGAWINPVTNNVTFSDGSGRFVNPIDKNAFSIATNHPNFSTLLPNGPVMIQATSVMSARKSIENHWVLATGISSDGKYVVAIDPLSGQRVEFSYANGNIGHIANIWDPKLSNGSGGWVNITKSF